MTLALSKYYDLRLPYYKYYISPTEFRKALSKTEESLVSRPVDTVEISEEGCRLSKEYYARNF